MVEKTQFAALFRIQKNNDNEEEFIPFDVVEGIYDARDKCFLVDNDVAYTHITTTQYPNIAHGYRTEVTASKTGLSKETIERIKKDLLKRAQKFRYKKINGTDIVIESKTTGKIISILKDTKSEQTESIETKKDTSKKISEPTKESSLKINMTPAEIFKEVKKTIKGQDEAIIKIVTALWITKKFPKIAKKNMLVLGPTGVGKTAIFEKLKKILNIPLVIFSVPGLSQAGYIGRSTDEILRQIYIASNKDRQIAEQSIVILDEIDKLAYRNANTGDIATIGVQNELLKIIEGCERVIEIDDYENAFEIDTSNIIFVGTGAFQDLFEKKSQPLGFDREQKAETRPQINIDLLKEYGIQRELLGRMPVIVELNSLTKEIFKEIILSSDESEFIFYIEALSSLGVTVKNSEEIIDFIIDDAMKREIGARGLIGTINNIFEKIFYEVANNPDKYQEVIIGPNIIKDNNDFQLIPKRIKTRRKIDEKGGKV